MINWQPIATAPLDDVLVYDGYDVWKAYRVKNKWYLSTNNVGLAGIPMFHEPTHWLPISDLLKPLGHL